MVLKNLSLLYHTVCHLKVIQVYYQVKYRTRTWSRTITHFKYRYFIPVKSIPLQFTSFIDKYPTFDNNGFTFLNQFKKIDKYETGIFKINWNDLEFGKLWAYNLNYMDYILQPELEISVTKGLIDHFIDELPSNKIGLEAYPISLRGINWIKFFWKKKIKNNKYDGSLYAQYYILYDSIEYHLLGNHLLENGFSLLFGAYYFNDKTLFDKAYELISHELKEQILNDGAHFELSPMYHQIILDRLLDCINLIQNNTLFSQQETLLCIMRQTAQRMVCWLNAMTFSNGEVPLLNDSSNGISPSTFDLNEYANKLQLFTSDKFSTARLGSFPQLNASGYRRYNGNNYECIVDVGFIGPEYQPGHAHADTLNFVLNVGNKAFIVDTGISTYEKNKTRLDERGTLAHNTVSINNENSSQIWSSFRVGRRAYVIKITDEERFISAKHNGYGYLGVIHSRYWKFKENVIEIQDRLEGKSLTGIAHFIFHPDVKPMKEGNIIKTKSEVLKFSNFETIKLMQIKIPVGYNRFSDSWKVEVTFKQQLETRIQC